VANAAFRFQSISFFCSTTTWTRRSDADVLKVDMPMPNARGCWMGIWASFFHDMVIAFERCSVVTVIETTALDSAGDGERLAVERRDGSFDVGRVGCVQGVQVCMKYVTWEMGIKNRIRGSSSLEPDVG